MGADPERTALVRLGHEAEEELAAHVVERRKPELVVHDQVGPQQALDEWLGQSSSYRRHREHARLKTEATPAEPLAGERRQGSG